MKNSLLKRLLTIISIILITAFLIGQIVGIFIMRNWFLKEQLKSLTPKMWDIVKQIEFNGESISIQNEDTLIIQAYDLDNNKITIENRVNYSKKYFNEEDIKESLLPFINNILKDNNIALITKLDIINGKSIVIGFPIKKDGKIVGTIFAVKPASDFDVIENGFYIVFFASGLISIIVILILISYFTKKLIKPLSEMVEVSNCMAAGNFSIRAKENGYGEINELSYSLNNLAQRLYENDESARKLEQTRRDYIANVSHELRTPISSIRAISETLCDDIVISDEKKQKYHLIIFRESQRLQKLINDMLKLSRLQSGEMKIKKNVVNGRNVISEIGDYFEVFAEDNNVELIITESAKNIPDFYSNESSIMQVLFILLDNAFKFTKLNGYVKLDSVYNDDIVKISVLNNGEPIDEDDLEFIFERFYKGDKSHNKKGSGLGLSLAKEIMNNLGEEISVKSSKNEDTKFEITIHRKLEKN